MNKIILIDPLKLSTCSEATASFIYLFIRVTAFSEFCMIYLDFHLSLPSFLFSDKVLYVLNQ
jgi:hypothetical protein